MFVSRFYRKSRLHHWWVEQRCRREVFRGLSKAHFQFSFIRTLTNASDAKNSPTFIAIAMGKLPYVGSGNGSLDMNLGNSKIR